MAKTRAITRFVPRPAAPVVIMQAPRRGRIRRAGAHVVRHVKRHATRGNAKRALPVLGLALGGAAIGYAESKRWLDRLPAIGGSRALPIAGVGWLITRFTKNPTARMAGVAMIVAGAFDYGRVQGGGVSGFDGGAGPNGGL